MNKLPQTSQPQDTPSNGSNAALRVGLIGGGLLGLAAMASRFTDSPSLSLFGAVIIVAGLAATGFYAARESGDKNVAAAARTGAVGGLIAGLLTGVIIVLVSLVQSLDPDTQRQIVAQTTAAMTELYSPQMMADFRASGVTVDAVYPLAVGVQLICCGAFLPLMGLGLGALGGRARSIGEAGTQ